MKRFFAKTFSGGPIALCSILLSLVAAGPVASAAPLQQARVSQVIQDVRLLEPHATPRPAIVNDKVTLGRAVRTGVESRAELTFTDLTITRLGANTIFSLTAGARQIDLTNGSILVQVPANAAPVKINTASVTVGITGGTALLSTGPPLKFMVLEGVGTIYPKGHPEKAVTVHGGEMVMVTADGRITQPTEFNVQLVLETSHLIVDFPPLTNLPLILVVMNQQLAEQQLAGTTSQLLVKNLIDVIDVTDQNANANPVVLAARTATPTPTPPPPTPTPTPPPPPTPTPTPSKFGPPSVITSPVPYVITSGTTITTDPTITTNGVTNFGKVWRGTAIDGPFSAFVFGSTSAFDTAIGLDAGAEKVGDSGAVFKFTSLELAGNPAVSTTNGQTVLALVGVNGITSGGPGGTLTFAGISTLLLATQDGSIDLGSEISFSGFQHLVFYARGAGSNLTLACPVSATIHLNLYAEGNIQVSSVDATLTAERIKLLAGDSIALDGGVMSATATNSSGNVDIFAGNQISITNGLEIDRTFGGQSSGLNVSLSAGTDFTLGSSLVVNVDNSVTGNLTDGANISLNTGGNLTINGGGDLSLTVANNAGGFIGTGGNISVTTGGNLTTSGGVALTIQNTTGTITDGGNITLMVGGSVSTSGAFSLLVENYDETANPAGHIGTGGNISLSTGGNLTANSMSVAINNRGGGMIDSGVNLTINIGGALTTLVNGPDFLGNPGSLSIAIATRFDNEFGNTAAPAIGGDATLSLQAGSASIGGIFTDIISNSGGTINGSALLNFNVTHDVTIAGDASIVITNAAAAVPFEGTIHGNATLEVTAATLSAGSLTSVITNRSGGVIDSNATISFNLSGNLTTQSDAGFAIQNDQNPLETAPTGGSIGSAAMIDISAADISIAGDFIANIRNDRDPNAIGPLGGFIGSAATLNITATSLSVGGELDAIINNQNNGTGTGTGGSIGGAATINLTLSGDLTTTGTDLNSGGIAGDANFLILNTNLAGGSGGTIDGAATITLSAASLMSAGSLAAEIFNSNQGESGTGGTIAGGADVTVTLSGSFTTSGDASLLIANDYGSANAGGSGGSIGNSAVINFSANNASIGGLFEAWIDNSENAGQAGGQIGTGPNGGNATVNVSITGGITANNQLLLIDNPGGQIGSNAGIALTASSVTASGNVASTNIFPGDFAVAIENDAISDGSSAAGKIGGSATIDLALSGNLTTANAATVLINNSTGGSIGSDTTISINALNVSTAGTFDAEIDNFSGGTIGGNATITVKADNISAVGGLSAGIDPGGSSGGHITTGASVNLTVAGNLTVGSGGLDLSIGNQPGTIGADANILASIGGNVAAGQFADGIIYNTFGSIGGNAEITTNIMGDLTAGGAVFGIYNFGGGSIGSNAGVTTNIGGNLTASDAEFFIWNYGLAQGSGSIGQNAFIDVNLTGDLNVQNGTADFEIINSNDGGSATIGGDATINVGAVSITANSLVAQIDNTGGSIGGAATINMNVSGTTTVTNGATVAIYGSNGAASAAINFNGGSYDVTSASGTFLGFIDGDGTITFNNASVHADVLRVGVLGTNGVLNIGGGVLSADTTLKLYAPGSNGTLNFISNVTLSSGTAMHLAANTITIQPLVLVTIAGTGGAANIYTTNANYSGFGGTNPSNGTFGGNGANAPQPLANAPLFGDPQPLSSTSSGTAGTTASTKTPSSTSSTTTSTKISSTTLSSSKTTSTKTASTAINVSDSGQLLALLDGAALGPDGKITISGSKSTSNSGNSSRINAPGRSNADHGTVDIRRIRDRAIDSRVGGGRLL